MRCRQPAMTADSTALVAHDYGVSVGQELLARDPARITSMTWLNGGLLPDLHRPTRGQRLLHGRLGPLVARALGEARFVASIREILGRQVSEEALRHMWLSMSARRHPRPPTPAALYRRTPPTRPPLAERAAHLPRPAAVHLGTR